MEEILHATVTLKCVALHPRCIHAIRILEFRHLCNMAPTKSSIVQDVFMVRFEDVIDVVLHKRLCELFSRGLHA